MLEGMLESGHRGRSNGPQQPRGAGTPGEAWEALNGGAARDQSGADGFRSTPHARLKFKIDFGFEARVQRSKWDRGFTKHCSPSLQIQKRCSNQDCDGRQKKNSVAFHKVETVINTQSRRNGWASRKR